MSSRESSQGPLPEPSREATEERSSGAVNRRGFIRDALVGAAAVVIAKPVGASERETRPPQEAPSAPVADPANAVETWDEPWVWRPSDFPGEALQLNVVEHENPAVIVGFGNPGGALFTYNGSTPGPTIRMGGDETYFLRLINHLGLNSGRSPVGPAPDLAAFLVTPTGYPEGVTLDSDWCIGEHTNGLHSAHTTNMHTHGLHVRPGLNPDGTHSDNIFVRLIPAADFEMRQERKVCDSLDADYLLEDEQVATGQWEFRLGNVEGDPDAPHPPGTHWYHPHPHGATHNEVSSGMAGFLIVEGDVDEALNNQLAGEPHPSPEVKSGPYDYRERLMLIQRVNPALVSADPDHIVPQSRNAAIPIINGEAAVPVITMKPGAIERWRILNGSVDGKGYLRFMVLEGQWVDEVPPEAVSDPSTLPELINSQKQLLRVNEEGERSIPTTDEIEAAKAHLYQLAVDGVTLVRETGDGGSQYYIRDLDFQAPANPLRQDFTNLGACYADAGTLNRCYDGPNEFYMAPANRTDILFQAPLNDGDDSRVYTILGKATAIHTENLERSLELAEQDFAAGRRPGLNFPPDTIMAYVVVTGGAVDGAPGYGGIPDLQLPDVPPYLRPITADDLVVQAGEGGAAGAGATTYRTRRIQYSGWGAATWPGFRARDVEQFDEDGDRPGPVNPVYLSDPDRDIPGLVDGLGKPFDEWKDVLKAALQQAVDDGDLSLDVGHDWVVAPQLKTMAIDGRKFNPDDPDRPRMLLDSAEEWEVVNNSISLYGTFDEATERANAFKARVLEFIPDDIPDPEVIAELLAQKVFSYLRNHTVGGLATRARAAESGWSITTRGIDHPFHIHVNPCWVMRIEVPDEQGNLVNVLGAPRWHDVVWLPRNGGRIVFRSRFPDFTGKLVNHCHILQHEDNGMMQPVEIVPDAADANFEPATSLPSESGPTVVTPELMVQAFRECSRFVDANPLPRRAQEYPATNGCFAPTDQGGGE